MEELLAQLLQQRALQTKAESDSKHGPVVQQLRTGYKPSPAPGMRGNAFDPDASHEGSYRHYNDVMRERFPRVPAAGAPPVYAGDGANNAENLGWRVPEYVTSADERNYRKEFGPRTATGDAPFEPLDLVTDTALLRDDDVSQTGWLPADFNGMSHAAAAALIADQLRTRRIRTMGELDPEYLAKLPVY